MRMDERVKCRRTDERVKCGRTYGRVKCGYEGIYFLCYLGM
jgi:hypothetical protein